MSRVQVLRAVVEQRLTAAVEEIFGLVERTISEYEEEIDRQRRLLEDVVKPKIQINTADGSQLLVSKEEVPPEQQQWHPCLDQEDPEPPHTEEELWTSQEGEQLQGLDETDIAKFPFTPVTVKSEDDEEEPQSSQLHQSQSEENREVEPLASTSTDQMKPEADGDCGGPEPASNLDPARDLQPTSADQLLSPHCAEPETEDSDDWEPQSGLNSMKPKKRQRMEDKHFFVSNKFRRTISCHLEKSRDSHSKKNFQQHQLLDTIWNPKVNLNRTDVQQLLVSAEEVHSEQQQRSPSLDQEDPEPPHIKVEREELWISQVGEQLQGLEETDITKFPFTPVPVKSEDDEEEPQSSQLHQSQSEENREAEPLASTSTEQMKTEADGDCGGSEPASNLHPTSDNQLLSSHCSEPETEDSDDYSKKTRESQSGLNTLKNNMILLSPMGSHPRERPYICTVCGKRFLEGGAVVKHMRIHTGERPFDCIVCGKRFVQSSGLKSHMRVHTGEKPFSCSVCGKRFSETGNLKRHVRVHTGEKPCCCSDCGKSFSDTGNLKRHVRVHTGEKPFSCSVCGKRSLRKEDLKKHMRVHTGEKPYSCITCGKRFNQVSHVRKHKCGVRAAAGEAAELLVELNCSAVTEQ